MAVYSKHLTEEECYLLALIQDESGIDLAEFLWEDPMADNVEKLFRCWDFQYAWWRNSFAGGKPLHFRPKLIIDQCSRAVGKTQSIILRGWAFAIQRPGAEMVVTAPEQVHLGPLTSRIEDRIKEVRLTRELLPRRPGMGFRHRPFQVDFKNGAKILGRIPQKDGKGVKGLHPLHLEMDESQDYPQPGWLELIETLRSGDEGSQWRAHCVSRGVRDEFYRHSQPDSGWTVHNITGMHRPMWTDQEREEKIQMYGSRDSPDYKRNILGVHGDATNPLFVLDRLMKCVSDPASGSIDDAEYNEDIYYSRRISYEMIMGGSSILDLIQIPGSHRKWDKTWAGMDVGLTDAPTEILVFGQEIDKRQGETLRLLTRIHMERVRSRDQRMVIEYLFDEYDFSLFTMDRGGVGFPLFQELQDGSARRYRDRVVGYTADEKLVVGWSDHGEFDDPKDFEIRRTSKEYGYDSLRELVDQKRLVLPWDRELLGEWQGQTYVREKSSTSPYGTKNYSRGSFHTLDAAAMMIVGKRMLSVEGGLKAKEHHAPAPIIFM